jgi:hypothetical protein
MNAPQEETLDPLARLRILSAALPGSVLAARHLRASFSATWRVIDGLERFTPEYERAVTGVRTVVDEGNRRRLVVTYYTGAREDFEVRLRPGWCLMQSPSAVVAFAARLSGRGTLLGHMEHSRRTRHHWSDEAALELELSQIEGLAMALDALDAQQ